jgi:hypothetical protein
MGTRTLLQQSSRIEFSSGHRAGLLRLCPTQCQQSHPRPNRAMKHRDWHAASEGRDKRTVASPDYAGDVINAVTYTL